MVIEFQLKGRTTHIGSVGSMCHKELGSNVIHTFTCMNIHEYLSVVTNVRRFFLETERCWHKFYASTDAECLKMIFQQIWQQCEKGAGTPYRCIL